MSVEWDEWKRRANLAKHGIDFVDAAEALADPSSVDQVDDSGEYGEERYQVLGRAAGQVLFVVYAERDDVRRIISARRASKREEAIYYQDRA
jgi:uncharacterized DUF497 family protein